MEKHFQSVAKTKYFSLSENTDESARLEKAFAQNLTRCNRCLTYRIPVEKSRIRLGYVPANLSLTFIWDTNCTLVSERFLAALGAALKAESANVFDTFPVESPSRAASVYFGFRCKNFILVRGSERVRHFQCPECGNVGYVAFGLRYLVEPVNCSIPLFEAGAGRIVIRDDVMQRLRTFDSLEIEELQIKQNPLDGLPVDLHVSKI